MSTLANTAPCNLADSTVAHSVRPFALTIFASSTLLFLIEPMIAKQILPVFGGAAAVWAMCLIFFQCALLLGYLYAHVSTQKLNLNVQIFIHALLAIAGALLLVRSGTTQPVLESAGNPALTCFKLLITSIGLPYFVLASTTPLLQSWYARDGVAKLPFRLFALSNLASLLALLAYPLFVERFLALRTQFTVWGSLYVGYLLLTLYIGARQLKNQAIHSESRTSGLELPSLKEVQSKACWSQRISWMALAACSSAMLLGVTIILCRNIAPVPLLWIVPLAVYLATFALCFDFERLFARSVYIWLTPLALFGLVWIGDRPDVPPEIAVPGFLICFFVICMFCHGQLAAMKPKVGNSTEYYVFLSLGGAVGGLFAGLVAPVAFSDFFEMKLAVALGLGLVLRFLFGYRSKPFLFVCVSLAVLAFRFTGTINDLAHKGHVLFQGRNFYGVLSVRETRNPRGQNVRLLVNGSITHGSQILTEPLKRKPTSYYGEQSGVGLAISRPGPVKRVGIIGLGAGTLAAYGRSGDDYRFYEINPMVVAAARSYFSYLPDSKAHVSVVLGDARLSLEHEPRQRFDLLVVDAFSGDSIPVHLLTKEAFKEYVHHLNSGGVLAIHVSNGFLNLAPVVGDIAAELGDSALFVQSEGLPDQQVLHSEWVLVSADKEFLNELESSSRGTMLGRSGRRLWTDQYSNLLAVFK